MSDIGHVPDRPAPRQQHRALYAAFDRYPAPKGAAVHIAQVARTLGTVLGSTLLYVLGDDQMPRHEAAGPVEIIRHAEPEPNVLERARAYGQGLRWLLATQPHHLRLCQFRDPWGGGPILAQPARPYVTIYEINGLPSIELLTAYPQAAPRTLAKIRAMEEFCWNQADAIVTPSATIRANLVRLGAPAAKIEVIPNGANLPPIAPPPPAAAPSRYLLYFGALQPWQGIEVLLRAFALLADFADLGLVICSSHEPHRAKSYQELAERLEIDGRLVWRFGLTDAELAPWRSHALLSVAPLTECARNLEQGCCPLKVLESMAAGVPVVASDLPALREIITDGLDGRLVRPDRPAELARAIRVLLEYPDSIGALGTRARQRIAHHFTWEQSTARLAELYRRLLPDAA